MSYPTSESIFGNERLAYPERMSLDQLVLVEVRSGRLRIPDFQRGLRWGPQDSVRLFDSILRGIPIGSFVLWQREGTDADLSRVGTVQIRVKGRHDAWFVVDGQQRLTALAAAMIPLDTQSPQFRVYLDYERWVLLSGDSPDLNPHRVIAISTLVGGPPLYRWAMANGVDNQITERLSLFAHIIRSYTLPVYFVKTEDEERIRDIFVRLNHSGARLEAHEVFQALRGGQDLTKEQIDLAALRDVGIRLGFGGMENAQLLRVVQGCAGLAPSRKPKSLAFRDLKKLPEQSALEEALQRSILFLMQDGDIPHIRLLPSPAVLALLARFFHLHREPHPVNRAALARWLWRWASSGLQQRSEGTQIRDTLRDIVEDEQETLRSLFRNLSAYAPAEHGWSLHRYHARDARSRIEVLALLARGPLRIPPFTSSEPGGTPATPDPLTLDVLIQAEQLATEVLVSSSRSTLTEEGRRLASTVANRILLHDRHAGLAAVLRPMHADYHREILHSHIISPKAFVALQHGQNELFLRLRAQDLSDYISRFVAQRARWDLPYIAPASTYLHPRSV